MRAFTTISVLLLVAVLSATSIVEVRCEGSPVSYDEGTPMTFEATGDGFVAPSGKPILGRSTQMNKRKRVKKMMRMSVMPSYITCYKKAEQVELAEGPSATPDDKPSETPNVCETSSYGFQKPPNHYAGRNLKSAMTPKSAPTSNSDLKTKSPTNAPKSNSDESMRDESIDISEPTTPSVSPGNPNQPPPLPSYQEKPTMVVPAGM